MASDARYRNFFESSRDAIMTLEPPSWRFTTGNPAAIEMFKAKNKDEFVSCEPWKLSPERQPDGRASDEKAKEMIAKALRDGSNFFEWTHKRINGEEFLVSVLLSRVEQDEKAFLLATVRDITEQKKAEEALRALSSRQQALLSAIPDIIVEVDKNKVFTWTNSAGFEFYGEDVLGKDAAFYFEGEQKTYDIIAPLFCGSEDVIYVESWQRRKDGKKRLLAWWCRTLKDGGGNVIGAISTARDITERKRAEEALRESEEKYSSYVENAPDGVFVVDEKGHFLEVNKAACLITGFTKEELLQMSIPDLLPKESLEAGIAHFKTVSEMGVSKGEFQFKHKDGSKRWWSVDAIKLRETRFLGRRVF